MMDMLRDPIWQVVIGIITLVATIWLAARSYSKKLSYEIIAKTSLVSLAPASDENRIRIFLDKKPIKNAELLLVKITNTGLLPIKSNDFESPLFLSLGKSAKVLDTEIYNFSPANLQIKFSTQNNVIEIDPVLLNSRDSFTVKIIAESLSEIELNGRIVGVKDIYKAGSIYPRRVITTSFIWLLVLALATWIFSGFTDYETPFIVAGLAFLFFFGGAILPRLLDWAKSGL
jgi:hypothetical protein